MQLCYLNSFRDGIIQSTLYDQTKKHQKVQFLETGGVPLIVSYKKTAIVDPFLVWSFWDGPISQKLGQSLKQKKEKDKPSSSRHHVLHHVEPFFLFFGQH